MFFECKEDDFEGIGATNFELGRDFRCLLNMNLFGKRQDHQGTQY